MKKVEAFIRHFKLEEVALALIPLGISGLTASEVRGTIAHRPWLDVSSGLAEFLPKVKLEVAVSDEMLVPVVDTIQRVARTGQWGDGKIFVTDVIQAVRIRTGETHDASLKAIA